MKKLLGIVVLGLLLCTSAYAKNLTFKPGSGPLKLSENTVKIFYIYLTEKLSEDNFQSWSSTFSEENFKAKKVPGSYMGHGVLDAPYKPAYANYFIISDGKPYILSYGAPLSTLGVYLSLTPKAWWPNVKGDLFAKEKKIVWKGGKKRISRKISLEELKVTLKELGFYDGD